MECQTNANDFDKFSSIPTINSPYPLTRLPAARFQTSVYW